MKDEDCIPANIQEKINKKIILGTISRFAPYKGVYELIELYSKLKSKYNNLLLIIVGYGEDKERILSLCGTLNLKYTFNANDLYKDDVEIYFTGSQKNPYAFLKLFDIFLLNSYIEGFPNVVLEAMFLGCRILSSNSTDVLYELKDNNENFEILPRYDLSDEKTGLWLKAFDKMYNEVKLTNKQRINYSNLQNYYLSNVLEKWKKYLLS
jgi:glycosyltransferase involved in cell wall biosynthesis